MTVPSVGRVVHVVDLLSGRCEAAIVTGDPDPDLGTLPVTVFPDSAPPFWAGAVYDEGQAGGTWHWPERV